MLLVRALGTSSIIPFAHLFTTASSCFNAFSRVDVRVDVKIPGSVLAYVIDLRGERHETTNEIWQETYMSAILRAILYGDDPTFWLEAYRRLDPITSREGEIRFLEAADALFSQGELNIPLTLFSLFHSGPDKLTASV